MTKSAKGSQFERELCRTLSRWWSGGDQDDLFWRTAGSGAMAKTRSKGGKATFGQYGDIQATDPSAQPLLDLISIEAKRGYSKMNILDLVDSSRNAAIHPLEQFLNQTIMDHQNAKSQYWAVIFKRDRHGISLIVPKELYVFLKNCGMRSSRIIRMSFPLRTYNTKTIKTKIINKRTGKPIKRTKTSIVKKERINICIFPFSDFLKCDARDYIVAAIKKNKKTDG